MAGTDTCEQAVPEPGWDGRGEEHLRQVGRVGAFTRLDGEGCIFESAGYVLQARSPSFDAPRRRKLLYQWKMRELTISIQYATTWVSSLSCYPKRRTVTLMYEQAADPKRPKDVARGIYEPGEVCGAGPNSLRGRQEGVGCDHCDALHPGCKGSGRHVRQLPYL